MSQPKYFCEACGIRTRKSKGEQFTCAHCRKSLCGAHSYQYVDGNNGAITRGSPTLCGDCYRSAHPNEYQIRPRPPVPTPAIQVTAAGPAYLLPGIEPAPARKGDDAQLAMF